MKDAALLVIVQLFGFATTITVIWLREYYIKRKLNSEKLSPICKAELFMQLTNICGEIKKDLNANGVYISYFHNGDYYKNGMSIDKFTVVAEDYDENISKGYIGKYSNMNISYISYLYHRLLTDGRCYKINVPNLQMVDNVYRQDLLDRNVVSSYSFLIKDDKELPIGFISIEYTYEFYFKREMESFIWKHQLSTSRKIKNIK